MKKVLSLLGLIAIFSIVSPAYAGGRGEVIHAGPGMHRQMRPHGGWYGSASTAAQALQRLCRNRRSISQAQLLGPCLLRL